ncbi:MAG: hypothetical protein JJU06_19365 [Ectothiorhodospiraceae bacterium]|nr:hypothetical protein [Ectothiorhodospiraceae bacterium]MCH8504060.1 hypothetical protein [Ectothiorhodospiraceae bacterium]
MNMSSPASDSARTEASAKAWLLDVGGGRTAAVGEKELQEVLVRPDTEWDSDAPLYRQETLAWRGRTLTVIDLGSVFGGRPDESDGWITVAAYQTVPGEPVSFGALRLSAAPLMTTVTDSMACTLPEDSLRDYLVWSYLALCFFRQADRVVPILDISRLFSDEGQRRLDRFCMSVGKPTSTPAYREGQA